MGSLFVTIGPNKGQLFRLSVAETVVGRDPQCQFQLTDALVSRHHFRLAFDECSADSGVTVSDLESVNGTFVNGVRLTASTKLNDGDDIRIGDTVLHFAARKLVANPALENQIHRQSEKYAQTLSLKPDRPSA